MFLKKSFLSEIKDLHKRASLVIAWIGKLSEDEKMEQFAVIEEKENLEKYIQKDFDEVFDDYHRLCDDAEELAFLFQKISEEIPESIASSEEFISVIADLKKLIETERLSKRDKDLFIEFLPQVQSIKELSKRIMTSIGRIAEQCRKKINVRDPEYSSVMKLIGD